MTEKESAKKLQDEEYPEESSCGLGSFRPAPLQCCKTVLAFSVFYGLVNLTTQTLGIYINSQVTAIEKQFDLSSSASGIILGSNDIGFLIAVLLFSHFGKYAHIPRVFGMSALLFGVSGIMISLCYFLDPYYLPKLSADDVKNSSSPNVFVAPLCTPDAESQAECVQNEDSQGTTGSSWQVWLLCIGMALQGVGKAPRQPLATTFIDNNIVDRTKTPFYLGITMTLMLLGPALAFVLGGVFRSMPIDLQDTVLTPLHPKWIGAWWLGFLVFGGLSLFVSIPMFFFPKRILPKKPEVKKEEQQLSTFERVKDLPKSLLRIFRRPVYTLTLCGVLCQMFIVAGKQAFLAKYVEKQFMQSPFTTNIIIGIMTLISAGLGTMAGAILASKLKLNRLGCIKLAHICNVVTVITVVVHYFLGCETPHVHGLHDDITPDVDDCSCSSVDYFPVCAEDGSNYFSPCYAGCTNQTNAVYGGCSEVASGQVRAGLCETDCNYLYYYLAVDMVQNLLGTLPIMPVYVTFIRSVEDRDKTLAIGIFSFSGSLFAFLPGPVVYGYIVDTACIVWSSTCGVQGACQQYDLYDLRIKFQSSFLILKVLFFLFFLGSFIVLKKQGGDKEEATELTVKKPEKAAVEEVKYAEYDESSRL